MDPAEIKETCERIVALYRIDPEEGHIYEDKFIQRFLQDLAAHIQRLSCDATDVQELQFTTKECMSHISAMLKTDRTKWYA